MYEKLITKQKLPKIQSLRDDLLARKDPDYFWLSGTQVYCGKQGSGKTVSAVFHLRKIKQRYPKSIIVTNLKLNGLKGININDIPEVPSEDNPRATVLDTKQMNTVKQYISIESHDDVAKALTKVNNGFKGVVYLIDEIHTYFNSLESKNIPMYIFTEISQQRKQRKVIIGTSQIFTRLAKPFREQCDNIIICRTFLGFWTFQTAYDGFTLDYDQNNKLVGTKKRSGWFFHDRETRSSFDTFQKVISGNDQYEQTVRVYSETKKSGLLRRK